MALPNKIIRMILLSFVKDNVVAQLFAMRIVSRDFRDLIDSLAKEPRRIKQKEPRQAKQIISEDEIIIAAKSGSFESVKHLSMISGIAYDKVIRNNIRNITISACKSGRMPFIEYLADITNEYEFRINKTLILKTAASTNFEVFEYIVRRFNCAVTSSCLKIAAENNQVEIVKYCLNLNKYDDSHRALKAAFKKGHLEVIKVFELFGHKADSNMVLQAVAGGHRDIVAYFANSAFIIPTYYMVSTMCLAEKMIPLADINCLLDNSQHSNEHPNEHSIQPINQHSIIDNFHEIIKLMTTKQQVDNLHVLVGDIDPGIILNLLKDMKMVDVAAGLIAWLKSVNYPVQPLELMRNNHVLIESRLFDLSKSEWMGIFRELKPVLNFVFGIVIEYNTKTVALPRNDTFTINDLLECTNFGCIYDGDVESLEYAIRMCRENDKISDDKKITELFYAMLASDSNFNIYEIETFGMLCSEISSLRSHHPNYQYVSDRLRAKISNDDEYNEAMAYFEDESNESESSEE